MQGTPSRCGMRIGSLDRQSRVASMRLAVLRPCYHASMNGASEPVALRCCYCHWMKSVQDNCLGIFEEYTFRHPIWHSNGLWITKMYITMAAFRTGGVGGVMPRCGGNGGATLPLLLFKLRSFDSIKLFALPLLAIPGYKLSHRNN